MLSTRMVEAKRLVKGFGRSRTEHSFSVMLAVEILRAELQALAIESREIKFFQLKTSATKPRQTTLGQKDLTEKEVKDLNLCGPSSMSETRFVYIEGIVGPFERCYPNNPPEDKRRNLRKVEAFARIFSATGSCRIWEPHYLLFNLTPEGDRDPKEMMECIYENGAVSWEIPGQVEKNAIHPCPEMHVSQVAANYRSIHGLE